MFRLLVIAALFFGAWKGYEHYQAKRMTQAHPTSSEPFGFTSTPQPSAAFTCDGRKYCSQMTSCQEATYFLKNCPGVKMDGNNDGVPCEQQWCKP
ncbi:MULTISPECIES: excalibur calcium-binding domain-containing protein [unclassified Variovorax]|jgi:disulfide bond formation protein DsbB|nr:Excalibur calcium-binding domain-containing protein [Variovorax sp. OK202]SFD87779.1 Excalibur calcium-binding domain-containing protein [Variovorax sp. OK212]